VGLRQVTIPVGDGSAYVTLPAGTEVLVARRSLTRSGVPIYHLPAWLHDDPDRSVWQLLDEATGEALEERYRALCGYVHAEWLRGRSDRRVAGYTEHAVRIRLEFMAGGGECCSKCLQALP
jgi:hypothetical protein